MSFPTECQLQGVHLHAPVLRENHPLPPLPPPPSLMHRIAALIKTAFIKLKWKKKGKDIQVKEEPVHESGEDSRSESFITI